MTSLTRRALSTSALALAAGCATGNQNSASTAAPARAPASIGAFGIDLTAIDAAVKPGDDFFNYVNGTWLAQNTIPDDRATWGSVEMLVVKAEQDVRAIVEEISVAGGAPGTNRQKIADYYNTFLNQDAIDARGLEPLQPMLQEIAALRTHEQVVRLMARPDVAVAPPIALFVALDQGNPDRYVPSMTQAGLGLPEREYYRRTDGEFPNIRSQYVAKIEQVLGMLSESNAGAKAQAIMAFETQIAERHWVLAQTRQRELVYNITRRADVRALAPRFPWDAYFEAAGWGAADEIDIREKSAMGPLAELMLATPVSTWRSYLTWHAARARAAVLPRAFDDALFEFFGTTLIGQRRQRERWRRAIVSLNGALGEAVGQFYVERHFSAQAKEMMREMVANTRRAYGERIDRLTWMSEATKVVAREKLAAFRPKIGYPDRWRDYSALEVRAGDAFGNLTRVFQWNFNRNNNRLGRPSDRDEWLLPPHTVNAYYNPVFNEVVFPAGFLQPPNFDVNADPAVNYGGIGCTIGHEMGHGFDDQGAKSDARGVLRDWWSAEDVSRFEAITARFVEQYNAFEPLPGLHVNGAFTLGENIGDNGGMQVALHAYRLSLNGRPAPVLEGWSGEQRFFLARGQCRRQLIRDQALRNQILTDPHSPARYRTNGVVRNMNAWYEAFDVQPGEALYLPPAERVEVW